MLEALGAHVTPGGVSGNTNYFVTRMKEMMKLKKVKDKWEVLS